MIVKMCLQVEVALTLILHKMWFKALKSCVSFKKVLHVFFVCVIVQQDKDYVKKHLALDCGFDNMRTSLQQSEDYKLEINM